MKRYGLRDDQFARIENLLPGRPGHVGRNSEKGNRLLSKRSSGSFVREPRQADLLPLAYFHVVVYTILFDAVAETLKTVGADPRHLGGELGFIAILHTWGQALTHHPHIHCLVPGGALSFDHERWVPCQPRFFLPIHVLSSLFRRLFLERLTAAYADGRLRFFGALDAMNGVQAFANMLRPPRAKAMPSTPSSSL